MKEKINYVMITKKVLIAIKKYVLNNLILESNYTTEVLVEQRHKRVTINAVVI